MFVKWELYVISGSNFIWDPKNDDHADSSMIERIVSSFL